MLHLQIIGWLEKRTFCRVKAVVFVQLTATLTSSESNYELESVSFAEDITQRNEYGALVVASPASYLPPVTPCISYISI